MSKELFPAFWIIYMNLGLEINQLNFQIFLDEDSMKQFHQMLF